MAHSVSHTRQRLRPWLSDQIDGGNYPSLEWIDREKMIFKIPWKHFGKPGVNDDDAKIFREWARHTGKYKDGDPADPSTWKTRFRCALYKLPDIQEIQKLNMLDGDSPYRVYKFKTKDEMDAENVKLSTESAVMNEIVYSPAPPECELEDLSIFGSLDVKVKEEMLDVNNIWSAGDLTQNIGPDIGIPNPEFFLDAISRSPITDSLVSSEQMVATTATGVSEAVSPLKIQLYYKTRQVEEKYVTNSTGCRIAFNPPPPLPEGVANPDSAEVVSHIYGPFQADQVYFSNAEDQETQRLLQYMKRGLVLQTYNCDVYATRLCQAKIFYSDSYSGMDDPQELTRENTTKVFDFQNRFKPLLEVHMQGNGPPPSCELYFSFGQRWSAANPLRDNMVHVCVTHVYAKKRMNNIYAAESSNNVLLSAPNALDMIATQIENINLETNVNGNTYGI